MPFLVAARLGNASYARYLLHPIVIETLRATVHFHPTWPASNTWTGMTLIMGVSCGLALIVYRWIEAPAIRALKRMAITPQALPSAAR